MYVIYWQEICVNDDNNIGAGEALMGARVLISDNAFVNQRRRAQKLLASTYNRLRSASRRSWRRHIVMYCFRLAHLSCFFSGVK